MSRRHFHFKLDVTGKATDELEYEDRIYWRGIAGVQFWKLADTVAWLSYRRWQFQAHILAAIYHLREAEPYGVPIRMAVEESLRRPVSYGALYAAIGQLEERGWIRHTDGAPLPERGERARR